ncbi:MAG: DUF4058 family protein [Planctomycetota bacterium]
MKSPFPGMDPYIEACGLWEDFHNDLIAEIKQTLNKVLPAGYTARLCERAYITLQGRDGQGNGDIERFSMQGDVSITGHQLPLTSTAVIESPVVVTQNEPLEMVALQQTEYSESYVEIRSMAPERPLVTTIEILSPSNKRYGTEGWDLYQRKRVAHLRGAANLVEIDLLRGGQRMPMETRWPDSPYVLLVSRTSTVPNCRVWRASFTSPVPTIPVPLAGSDPDVPLSLQPMIESIYERSRYFADIDYRKPCVPPLNSAEETWFRGRHPGSE